MLSLILNAVVLIGPGGIDFSALPAEAVRQQFKYWLVVHAADGSTFDYGEWCQFGGFWSRDRVMEEVEEDLMTGGCKVKRCGDMLVVQTLNGSPVVRVDVMVKDATGATPLQTWALRSQPDKPKKEKK